MAHKITITLTTGNDQFRTPEQVAQALRNVASSFEIIGLNNRTPAVVRDENGNTVGTVELYQIPE